jgi:hypothetical protein
MLYSPVIKSKRGELTALRLLSRETKLSVLPLIDVLPPSPFGDRPKALVDQLVWVVAQVVAAWNQEQPLFVDSFDVGPAVLANQQTPIEYLCRALQANNVKAIPVTGTQREASHDEGVARIAEDFDGGICFRLEREDLLLPKRLPALITQRLDAFRAIPSKSDLILDLRLLGEDSVEDQTLGLRKALQAIPDVQLWRNVILTGSAMPNSLLKVCERGESAFLERREMTIWSALAAEVIPRYPAFGDYTTVPPLYADMDTRTIAKHLGPNVKYTLKDQWFISRGKSFQKFGSNQYFDIAQEIAALRGFRGPTASYGERFIADRASGKIVKSGNPEQWIIASVNSHITYLVNHLQSRSIVPYK